jgi:hypothetical protein
MAAKKKAPKKTKHKVNPAMRSFEERVAWDEYVSAILSRGPVDSEYATSGADKLLELRRKRFGRSSYNP